jgi:hypothetical protein
MSAQTGKGAERQAISAQDLLPEQWIEQDEESTSLERLLREIDIIYKMGHDGGALEVSKWAKNGTK